MPDANNAIGAAPKFKPESITKPMQLLAAGGLILVSVDLIFLGAAATMDTPSWVRPTLVIAAIGITVVGMLGLYRLMTKHRPSLQDDGHYAKGLDGKVKELTKQMKSLGAQLDNDRSLAEQRLDNMDVYFRHVTDQLNIRPHERARLGRALRESVQAGEDRVADEMAHIFVRNAQTALEAGSGESSEQLRMLIDGIITSRYERTLAAYGDLVKQDVRSIDLVVDLRRVVVVYAPQRGVVNAPNPPLLIQATPGIVESVLKELMINAAAYSTSDSPIDVAVTSVDEVVELVIANELQPADQVSEEWLKPEVRGKRSAELNPNGAGMGLALVQRLLALVGATMQLRQVGRRVELAVRFRRG